MHNIQYDMSYVACSAVQVKLHVVDVQINQFRPMEIGKHELMAYVVDSECLAKPGHRQTATFWNVFDVLGFYKD